MSDSVKMFYESARNEIVTRMKLRDNVILVFLGAVSTLFAVAIKSDVLEILFCVPYLSLGATMIIAQHYMAIGRIAFYCVREIGPFLEQQNETAPQWDTSNIFYGIIPWSVRFRCISCMVLLGLPSIMVLILTGKHAVGSAFPYGPLWWISLFCLLGTMITIWWIHNDRLKLYMSPKWPWKKS